MIQVRPVRAEDKSFWMRLDRHLSKTEFDRKVRDQMGYVITENGVPAGLLRYNLFWDSIPFCTMLFIDPKYQNRGLGSALMAFWEKDLQTQGYKITMTSTQADETAQHFYRKIGYRDCGGLLLDIPEFAQPTELFFIKALG